MQHDHTFGKQAKHPLSHKLIWGLGLATAAISLSPYLLTYTGLTDPSVLGETENLLHTETAFGTGMAGGISKALSYIPLVGTSLATGTLAPILATAAIGVGGVLIANWLAGKESENASFRWSSVIRNAALATSIFIALPALLNGITTGLSFFALAMGDMGETVTQLHSTIGIAAGHNSATTLLGASIPHLFLCGVSLLPVGLALWMDGRSKTPPAIEWVSRPPTQSNREIELQFRLIDPKTRDPIEPDKIAVTHTEKLHMMIVDASLTDYLHVHPQYDEKSQSFHIRFTPKLPHPYRAWMEFTPKGTQTPVQLQSDLPAAQKVPATPIIANGPLPVDASARMHIDSLMPLTAGKSNTLEISILDQQGRPVTDLQPILGATAHLVGFSADGRHMIHCHPDENAPPGKLRFDVHAETAGPVRFFLQINRNGEEITLPFGMQIHPSRTQLSAPPAQPHAAMGHAH